MIGNVTEGGSCNLQGSPIGAVFTYTYKQSSFVALATGRDGVIFALVQPDLLGTTESASSEVNPNTPVGGSEGDQIVEVAPGEASAGAGDNASKWEECPQPERSFSITNTETGKEVEPVAGEIAVPVGTTLKFNAEEVRGTKGEFLSGV